MEHEMVQSTTIESAPSESSDGTRTVFISWSGDTSRSIAEALASLVTDVFQDVSTFVSSNSIEAGTQWFGQIAHELARTSFGILCLTAENLESRWIHFEAGALAKQITEKARVVPYCYGMSPSNLAPPLNMFNGVQADMDGTLKLLKSINQFRPSPFEPQRLKQVFDKWWPDFDSKMSKVPSTTPPVPVPSRSEREMLEEVLARVRGAQDAVMKTSIAESHNVSTARAQLALKIADIEVKRLEMEKDPHDRYKTHVLFDVLQQLRSELEDLRRMA